MTIRIVLLTSSLLLSLLLCEGIFRWYEQSFLLPKLPTPGVDRVSLDRLNYNDFAISSTKEPTEYRLLSFGDSFGYSIMQPPHSYNGVLQKELASALPGRKIRVVNLGEPATAPYDYIQAAKFWSEILEHDGVVFNIYMGNDITYPGNRRAKWTPASVFADVSRAIHTGRLRPSFVPSRYPSRMLDYIVALYLSQSRDLTESEQVSEPELYNVASLNGMGSERRYLEHFGAQTAALDPALLEEIYAVARPDLPMIRQGYAGIGAVLSLAARMQGEGKDVFIALSPNRFQMGPEDFRRRVRETLRDPDHELVLDLPSQVIAGLHRKLAPQVPLFDLSSCFAEASEAGSDHLYYRWNTHWGRGGNELAGQILASAWLHERFSREAGPQHELPDCLVEHALLRENPLIDRVVAMTLTTEGSKLEVTGSIHRSDRLFDGIKNEPSQHAIARHGAELLIKMPEPRPLNELRIFLYDEDGRFYNFLVDARVDQDWRILLDATQQGRQGMVSIPLGGESIDSIRLVSNYNSNERVRPNNKMIHILEIEIE